MPKITSILFLSTAALMLSACGGSGSDTSFSSFTSTKKFGQVTYVCTTRAAADACTGDNSCAAQSACTRQGTNNTPVATCSVSGNNVTVPNNSQCTFSQAGVNNGATLTYSCSNGALTNGGATFGGGSVNFNGTTISCAR